MTIVGFLGSVRNATERGSGIELIPPNLTLILILSEDRGRGTIDN